MEDADFIARGQARLTELRHERERVATRVAQLRNALEGEERTFNEINGAVAILEELVPPLAVAPPPQPPVQPWAVAETQPAGPPPQGG